MPSDPSFISGYRATVTRDTPVDRSAHEETAQALFFYENMQGTHPDKDKFYTSRDKNQSIIFPQTGYRDWDDNVNTYHFNVKGYIWAAGNVKNDGNRSYNFEFSRTDGTGYIRPQNNFFPCDGFPIRPVRNGSHRK